MLPGQSNNVGSGYWTHAMSSGQTFYLIRNGLLTLSTFEMYEFHTTQEATGVHPGQNLDLDYSLVTSLIREPATFQLADLASPDTNSVRQPPLLGPARSLQSAAGIATPSTLSDSQSTRAFPLEAEGESGREVISTVIRESIHVPGRFAASQRRNHVSLRKDMSELEMDDIQSPHHVT